MNRLPSKTHHQRIIAIAIAAFGGVLTACSTTPHNQNTAQSETSSPAVTNADNA